MNPTKLNLFIVSRESFAFESTCPATIDWTDSIQTFDSLIFIKRNAWNSITLNIQMTDLNWFQLTKGQEPQRQLNKGIVKRKSPSRSAAVHWLTGTAFQAFVWLVNGSFAYQCLRSSPSQTRLNRKWKRHGPLTKERLTRETMLRTVRTRETMKRNALPTAKFRPLFN